MIIQKLCSPSGFQRRLEPTYDANGDKDLRFILTGRKNPQDLKLGVRPGSISPLRFFSKHSVPSAGRRVCGLALAMDGNVLTSVQASVRHSSPEPFLRPSWPYTPGPLALSLPRSLPRRLLRGPIGGAARHLGQLQGRAHASGLRSTALRLSGSPEPQPGTPPQEPSPRPLPWASPPAGTPERVP